MRLNRIADLYLIRLKLFSQKIAQEPALVKDEVHNMTVKLLDGGNTHLPNTGLPCKKECDMLWRTPIKALMRREKNGSKGDGQRQIESARASG